MTGEKIAPLRGRRAQLTGSGWDSATRGEGPRRNRWNWASPRWCSSPPSPCLSSPHPGCLSVWTKGREKKELEQPPKTGPGGSNPTRSDPRGGAWPAPGMGWPPDRSRGRRAARAEGYRATAEAADHRRRRRRAIDSCGGGAERNGTVAGGGVARRRGAMCGPLQQTR